MRHADRCVFSRLVLELPQVFKLFVMLKSGNKAGSAPLLVERPLAVAAA